MIETNAVSSSPMAIFAAAQRLASAELAYRPKIEPVLQANWRRFTLDSAAAPHGKRYLWPPNRAGLAKSRCALSARPT